MLTLLHGSDLHFGKAFDPEPARAFLEVAERLRPDLIVLSGDFTQRAKVREYEAAREFLDRLPDVPTVVTPGNHDVPLYRVWERLFAPLRNYRRHISPDLDTVTRVKGATVVALNSTAPRRAVVNGRLDDRQLLFAAEAFAGGGEGDLRVVVAHHHLAPAPDYEPDQVLPGFQRCLEAFARMKVDLILGGHLHRAYVGSSLDVDPAQAGRAGIVIAHCGTTTSRRGRARERSQNTFNLITVGEDRIGVVHYIYLADLSHFAPFRAHLFPRRPRRTFDRDPLSPGGTPKSSVEAGSSAPAGPSVGAAPSATPGSSAAPGSSAEPGSSATPGSSAEPGSSATVEEVEGV